MMCGKLGSIRVLWSGNLLNGHEFVRIYATTGLSSSCYNHGELQAMRKKIAGNVEGQNRRAKRCDLHRAQSF